jgi:hypothetical protein
MSRKSPFTLTALMLAVALAGAACGKDGGGGDLTDPGPIDPDPTVPGPEPEPAPVPVGNVVYAVDLKNNLLVFGTESFDVLSGQARITGLPILNRVIGIVYRPSDGKLYGVGNDSRVYIIDPSTAVATPVSDQSFEPGIVEFFEIHFAMALEPNGDRVRLISTEGGGNWSISLDDGTATMGESVYFGAGPAEPGGGTEGRWLPGVFVGSLHRGHVHDRPRPRGLHRFLRPRFGRPGDAGPDRERGLVQVHGGNGGSRR